VAATIFGYSTAEALGLRVEALVPKHLKDQHRAGIARYAKTGHRTYIDSHRPLELPALRKDGRAINVERLEERKRTGDCRRGDSGPSNSNKNIVTYRGCKIVTSRLRVY
jgi:PAS domain S-box-containing protein